MPLEDDFETCRKCGKTTRIRFSDRPSVPWRHEYVTIVLACGHESAGKYDEDGYRFKVELVPKLEEEQP